MIEAKRKRAVPGAEAHAPGRTKPVVVLETVPVGSPPGMFIVCGRALEDNGRAARIAADELRRIGPEVFFV